jgi:hypothetical protein
MTWSHEAWGVVLDAVDEKCKAEEAERRRIAAAAKRAALSTVELQPISNANTRANRYTRTRMNGSPQSQWGQRDVLNAHDIYVAILGGGQHRGMMDAHDLADRPGTFTRCKPLASLLALFLVELGLAPELNALGLGDLPTVRAAGKNTLPLVLGQGAEECDQASIDRRGEVQVRLVENLDQRPALMDAVDDRHAVDHAACGSVPLCHDEDVAGAQLINCLLEHRAVPHTLAARLLPVDDIAALSPQRANLPVQILCTLDTRAYPIFRIMVSKRYPNILSMEIPINIGFVERILKAKFLSTAY